MSLTVPLATSSASAASAARENASFLYQPLTAATLPHAGSPKLMVVTHSDAAAAARSVGMRAYKYLQFNWFPTGGDWNGTTAAQRSAWRICGASGQPVGDGTSSTKFLWYADFNERGFSDAMVAYALTMKARGFDGLFVDVSGRALTGPQSTTLSKCTEKPMTPKLRSSDAYVRLLQRIKALGLRIAINFPSQFPDPLLRPAPVGGAAVNDLRPLVDFILHENAASVDQVPWYKMIARLRDDAMYSGGKVIEMAKSLRMPGSATKSEHERSVWALAKLSGQPVVLNTGNDLCVGVGAVPGGCLRMGLAPDLVNVQLGAAIDPVPRGTTCDQVTSTCAWYRRFQSGFVVYNPGTDAKVRKVTLTVANDGSCRLVHEVRGGNITSGKCVKALAVSVKPNQGRIFTYTR